MSIEMNGEGHRNLAYTNEERPTTNGHLDGYPSNGHKHTSIHTRNGVGEGRSESSDETEAEDPLLKTFRTLFSTATETRTPIRAEIVGKVPRWLCGTLIRNGPGIYELGKHEYKHLFDPLGLIQRFHFDSEKVFYTSEFLPTDTYEANVSTGSILAKEFGTKAMKRGFNKLLFAKNLSDNSSLNVFVVGDKVYTTPNQNLSSYRIKWDARTIAPIVKEDWKWQKIKVPASSVPSGVGEVGVDVKLKSVCPNPLYDDKGTLYNVAISSDSYCFFRIQPDSGEKQELEILSKIPFEHSPAYIHSFGMTENCFVLFESPHRISKRKQMIGRITGRPTLKSFRWKKHKKTNIYLVNRHEQPASCMVFQTDPLFVLQHINAFEESGCVVVDVVGWGEGRGGRGGRGGLLGTLRVDQLRKGNFPDPDNLHTFRFVLPIHVDEEVNVLPGEDVVKMTGFKSQATCILTETFSIHCSPEDLVEQVLLYPTINYKLVSGKKYKYCYALDVPYDGSAMCGTKVMKVDVEEGTRWEWRREEGELFASQPLFVPKPDTLQEDDGVLLVPITNTKEGGRSFLLILDGETMEEVGRAETDVPIAFSFYGTFISRLPLRHSPSEEDIQERKI